MAELMAVFIQIKRNIKKITPQNMKCMLVPD